MGGEQSQAPISSRPMAREHKNAGGELPGAEGSALARTHAHTDSPCHFSFGLSQPHGIRTQVQGWGNMVTSLRSMTLETQAGPKTEQILGAENRMLIY